METIDEIVAKKQAIAFLNIDAKTFDNYFKNAREFNALLRPSNRGFFKFKISDLEAWKQSFNWRSGVLSFEDYTRCLDFALAMHYKNYVNSDFGTGRKREFGQKVSNWMKGQLGELAFQKFLKEKFNIDIELDFEIRDEFVAQDVSFITDEGVRRTPRIGVGIKTSKPKSSYLVLSEGDVREGRKSDVYIFCRVDIPDDHLLRISKDKVKELMEGHQHFDRYKDLIPGFEEIPYEIAGWCEEKDLKEVTSIPGQEFTGVRYVIPSGLMHKEETSWKQLIARL